MKVLDLFSGIGGMAIGLERAGMETVAFCEISPFCRRVLARHWPKVNIHHDIRTLSGRHVPFADLVCGGFPCKQTSIAAAIHGKRNGLAGDDSGLWYEMLRIIKERNHRWVIVENPASQWLEEVAGDLADAGYSVRRHEIEAGAVGAPHLRRRVFTVANLDGKGLEIAGPTRSPAPLDEERLTIARRAWLADFAGVGRVDDGVPGGLDRRERIRALGNAVVPAAVEVIARAIMAAEYGA